MVVTFGNRGGWICDGGRWGVRLGPIGINGNGGERKNKEREKKKMARVKLESLIRFLIYLTNRRNSRTLTDRILLKK